MDYCIEIETSGGLFLGIVCEFDYVLKDLGKSLVKNFEEYKSAVIYYRGQKILEINKNLPEWKEK